MSVPRVAVVIPSFNDGIYLQDAIASLNDQEPCEVVVVDDGSDDPQTLDIFGRLRSEGVRVLRHENQGLGASRMAGVLATSAPLVHPLDADDRLAPGALTALAEALEANPQAGAAWGDVRRFGATECLFPQAPDLDPWRITYMDEIPGTSMVHRDAILAVEGWDDDCGYEDWDFWMKLAERGYGGVRVPRVTLLYREHLEPRMYAEELKRHERNRRVMRMRRRSLYARRRETWRRSPSPLSMKIALPLIDLVPGLSELRRHQLYFYARHILQRRMSSDCYLSLRRRLYERLVSALRVRGR